ncbi:MAG: transporter ATP-binding protein [Rhodospirillales bacterium]|jgi:ABC-2 type transport system ATP-binding protein|nr:transporter ATP-binding protein [Rhodospirillales bacterium]
MNSVPQSGGAVPRVTTDEPALVVSHLVKRFDAIVAVNDISFIVERGSVTALLGGNGAGKTTTMAMLLGALKPTSGDIHALGIDMAANRYAVIPRMNFSSPYVALPARLTVRENLTVFAHLYGLDRIGERIERIAESFDMKDLLKTAVGKLSAGQKTRAGLAKALLNDPELLLLDEPTASLDPDTADWIRSYFERYCERTGATILLASHHMGEVERLCDYALMMRRGQIADRGSPSELVAKYGRQNLEEVFLDIARANDEEHRKAAQ